MNIINSREVLIVKKNLNTVLRYIMNYIHIILYNAYSCTIYNFILGILILMVTSYISHSLNYLPFPFKQFKETLM